MNAEIQGHILFLRADPDYDRKVAAAALDFAIDSVADAVRDARLDEASSPKGGYATGLRHGMETSLIYMREVRRILDVFSAARAEMAAEMAAPVAK